MRVPDQGVLARERCASRTVRAAISYGIMDIKVSRKVPSLYWCPAHRTRCRIYQMADNRCACTTSDLVFFTTMTKERHPVGCDVVAPVVGIWKMPRASVKLVSWLDHCGLNLRAFRQGKVKVRTIGGGREGWVRRVISYMTTHQLTGNFYQKCLEFGILDEDRS